MKPNLVELDADHPGFHDKDYRRRRDEIAKLAENHELGKPLPVVEFTETETATWRTVYAELSKLFPTHGCHEYNEALKLLGFSGEAIPQLADLDKSLHDLRDRRLFRRDCLALGLLLTGPFERVVHHGADGDAWPAIQGCESGKDVFVEKPASRTIAEGRAMVRAVRRHGVVLGHARERSRRLPKQEDGYRQ